MLCVYVHTASVYINIQCAWAKILFWKCHWAAALKSNAINAEALCTLYNIITTTIIRAKTIAVVVVVTHYGGGGGGVADSAALLPSSLSPPLERATVFIGNGFYGICKSSGGMKEWRRRDTKSPSYDTVCVNLYRAHVCAWARLSARHVCARCRGRVAR